MPPVPASPLTPHFDACIAPPTHSLVRCWARPVSTSATAWSDAKGGEFMNKEKFDSMVPKDGLGDLDVDVPVIEAGKKNYSPRVTELATQILELNLLEIADLCDILKVGHRCCCWCHSCERWASVLCPDPLTP